MVIKIRIVTVILAAAGLFLTCTGPTSSGGYALFVSATNGSVTKYPNKANYASGETVRITATANTGYLFDTWTGDISGSDNPAVITMDANKSVAANFLADNGIDYSGSWVGKTSAGNQMDFTVENNWIKSAIYQMSNHVGQLFAMGNGIVRIINGTFSVKVDSVSFSGTFTTPTSCTGFIQNTAIDATRYSFTAILE
jgi:Divergent InlB B-repeat domain